MRTVLLTCIFLAGTASLPAQVIILPGSSSSNRPTPRVPTPRVAPPPRVAPTPRSVPASMSPLPSPWYPGPLASSIMVSRQSPTQVYVASDRLAISNVVLQFADGSRQRYEDVDQHVGSFYGTGGSANKPITTVWVKAGPNFGGDGPGYGQRFDLSPLPTHPEPAAPR